MTDTRADDWANYWAGRIGGDPAQALAGPAIETSTAIAAVWQDVFKGYAESTRVLDLACGGGTALRAAASAGLTNLTGVDIAPAAIEALLGDLPAARGVVASASDTGLPAAQFDCVVSQFGFEYAGAAEAARESARLIAPGGVFAAIAHIEGGAIAHECQGKLDQIQAIQATDFIPKARKLFRALFDADARPGQATTDKANRAVAAFKPAMAALQSLAEQENGHGLAQHLYQGTGRMYGRRTAYLLSDIEDWLTGMRGEIDAYAGRMRSMVESALSVSDIDDINQIFAEAGATPEPPVVLDLGRPGAKAAWLLRTAPKTAR